MRVLLLGATGLLGSELKKIFSVDYNLTALSREDLDITNKKLLWEKIKELQPKIIINATGYTAVDKAQDEKDLAMAINGHAVGNLAQAAKNVNALLIHYSTDYVFDGNKEDGYTEDDLPAKVPSSVYGQSKLLGETLLQKNANKYYLIRTSWVFGENGKDFVDTMIRLAQERDELRVVNDQHGKPTYAKDLAKATLDLLESSAPMGIYHFTNEGATTWYEYAKKIIGTWGKLKKWGKKEFPHIVAVTSSEFPTPAKRPNYSILINTKFPPLRPWQDALDEYLEEI